MSRHVVEQCTKVFMLHLGGGWKNDSCDNDLTPGREFVALLSMWSPPGLRNVGANYASLRELSRSLPFFSASSPVYSEIRIPCTCVMSAAFTATNIARVVGVRYRSASVSCSCLPVVNPSIHLFFHQFSKYSFRPRFIVRRRASTFSFS